MELKRDQVNTIIKNAPVGSSKSDIISGLIKRGYDIEGIDTNQAKQMLGLSENTPVGYSDTMGDIKQIGTDITNTTKEGIKSIKEAANAGIEGKQNPFRTAFQQVGAGLGTVSNIFGDIIKGAVKVALPNEAQKSLKGGLEATITPVIQSDIAKGILEKYNSLDDAQKRDVNAALGIGSFALDVTGAGAGGKAAETGIKAAKEGAEILNKFVTETGEELLDVGGKAINKATNIISPKPTTEQAIKQVLQGGTKDIPKAARGLISLDTTGVKTFKDLGGKISSKITELANKVDSDLAQDTTKTLLDDLIVTGKTTSGKSVSISPVKTALTQLEELYSKIGDDVALANIKELENEAIKTGLTKLQINNLAKKYGQEFGEKAFSKMGDPLTSVNAQMYENTRKNIKNLAREGINGEEAKAADLAMSDLYDTQRLIQKNIEAVNKLQNKIKNRGIFEKAGYYISKYADILSGGSVRGLVGGLLPRGVGNKIMNAVDLEESLSKNLKIINDAINSKSDEEIKDILKNLKIK